MPISKIIEGVLKESIESIESIENIETIETMESIDTIRSMRSLTPIRTLAYHVEKCHKVCSVPKIGPQQKQSDVLIKPHLQARGQKVNRPFFVCQAIVNYNMY